MHTNGRDTALVSPLSGLDKLKTWWGSYMKTMWIFSTSANTAHKLVDYFVTRMSDATQFWAKLLQAISGNLEPSKCYFYMMIWK